MFLEIDSNASVRQIETYQWFTKMISLMDNGPADNRWWQFVNYTKGAVFHEKGYLQIGHSDQFVFNWPANPGFKAPDVLHKDIMREVIKRADDVADQQLTLNREKPETGEKEWLKYLVSFLFCLGLSAKILKVWFDYMRTRILSSSAKPSNPGSWLNSYNIVSCVGFLLGLALCWVAVRKKTIDQNKTYYIISVSAIYASVLLTYLLQKVFSIRTQKEVAIDISRPLWVSVTEYRYLCRLFFEHLEQYDHLKQKKAIQLKVDRETLAFYRSFGENDKLDAEQWKILETEMADKDYPFVDFVLLVKKTVFFCSTPADIFSHVAEIHHVVAYDHRTINEFLIEMSQVSVFQLLAECVKKSPDAVHGMEEFLKVVSKHSFYGKLLKKGAFTSEEDVLNNLVRIEKYIFNSVLLKLNDQAPIVERPLPLGFLHLLFNTIFILIFGTIVPLANTFIFNIDAIIWCCGGLLVSALLVSAILLVMTFFRENNHRMFDNADIIY
ncbi:hypothetical protein GCM10011500_09620 [Mucilaginibacter rubeus]|nr:hypothetical protein GCM10011500_09620 [Mucilaginibacter rubeus]